MSQLLLPEAQNYRNLLVDSNLLVLYVVGGVNVKRVGQFKRTAKYTAEDYWLLTGVMKQFPSVYTVPQVMSEVSNLTDLPGRERQLAREKLKQTIREVVESEISSGVASEHICFRQLGLTDAAIASAAQQHNCLVLTDDLPLYVWLSRADVPAVNYTHLRERFSII